MANTPMSRFAEPLIYFFDVKLFFVNSFSQVSINNAAVVCPVAAVQTRINLLKSDMPLPNGFFDAASAPIWA